VDYFLARSLLLNTLKHSGAIQWLFRAGALPTINPDRRVQAINIAWCSVALLKVRAGLRYHRTNRGTVVVAIVSGHGGWY